MNRSVELPSRRVAASFCALVVAGILIVGLWPFHSPRNGVRWRSDSAGLQFGRNSTVMSKGPLSTGSGPETAASLEIWITPDNVTGDGTILAFDSGTQPRLPLAIRQYCRSIALQTSVLDDSGIPRRPWLKVNNALQTGERSLITITASPGSTSVYINGKLRGRSPDLHLRAGSFSAQMVVGNSTTDDLWQGTVSGFALYGRLLTPDQVQKHFASWNANQGPVQIVEEPPSALYLFQEGRGNVVASKIASAPDLEIPERYQVLHPAFIALPWDDSLLASRVWTRGWYWKDMAINIAGFVPLGFLITASFAPGAPFVRSALTALALGFLLSFMIEGLQFFLPTRDSSLDDLVNNTIGTAAGTLFYRSSRIRAVWVRTLAGLGLISSIYSEEIESTAQDLRPSP
jgi:hypothetical protein